MLSEIYTDISISPDVYFFKRQYRYVYEAVLEYLEGGDTVIPTVRLEETIPPDTQTKLEREYKVILSYNLHYIAGVLGGYCCNHPQYEVRRNDSSRYMNLELE